MKLWCVILERNSNCVVHHTHKGATAGMVSGAKRTHKADMHGHLAFAVVQARKLDAAGKWSGAKWSKLSKDLHVQVSGVALSHAYSNFVTNEKAKVNKLLVMPA